MVHTGGGGEELFNYGIGRQEAERLLLRWADSAGHWAGTFLLRRKVTAGEGPLADTLVLSYLIQPKPGASAELTSSSSPLVAKHVLLQCIRGSIYVGSNRTKRFPNIGACLASVRSKAAMRGLRFVLRKKQELPLQQPHARRVEVEEADECYECTDLPPLDTPAPRLR